MGELPVVAQVISGSHGELVIRQKKGAELEIGDLLVTEIADGYQLLQVFDLAFGSQMQARMLELVAGMKLEGAAPDLGFMDEDLSTYILASVRAVLTVTKDGPRIPKTLPSFMGTVRHAKEEHFRFLTKPEHPMYLGQIRSGSKLLDVPVYINAEKAFTHHILVPATTGRGKSNLVKVLLYSSMDRLDAGVLILDPHDEYYGRTGKGLKDHQRAPENLRYYTPRRTPGSVDLVLNLADIRPYHITDAMPLSDAQREALWVAFGQNQDHWISLLLDPTHELPDVHPGTQGVLRRRFAVALGLEWRDGRVESRDGTFSEGGGLTTLDDILGALEAGKKVIVDTSIIPEAIELLVGSVVTHEILNRYRRYKLEGSLTDKPVVSVVLEEAPRVLGEAALATGNIFGAVAREGRKFKVGLLAITQLASLIPRDILANVNTKIILGNEMGPERAALINSAAQDLSQDDRAIASLDIGEAIVSSNFTRFAIPIRIPLFEEMAQTGKRPPVVFHG